MSLFSHYPFSIRFLEQINKLLGGGLLYGYGNAVIRRQKCLAFSGSIWQENKALLSLSIHYDHDRIIQA